MMTSYSVKHPMKIANKFLISDLRIGEILLSVKGTRNNYCHLTHFSCQ